MALTYQQLLHNTGLRMNALVGSQFAALQTTYQTTTLTTADFKSADWPLSAFRDAILMSESDYAWAISLVGNHPWRKLFASYTAGLADKAELPSVNSTAVPIIGTFGVVRDTTDNTPLDEMPLRVIDRRVRASHYTLPVYWYKIAGGIIRHTREEVELEVCTYDRAARLAAFNTNGNSLFPEVMELPISAHALGIMVKSTKLEDLPMAQTYGAIAEVAFNAIRAGHTSVVSKSVPVPVTLERAG